jgi:photosystem I P700 chlorophyll a apoprotein A2
VLEQLFLRLRWFHPQTQSLWLTDIAHHHLAIAVLFIIAGHMYRTNFGIGHSMKEILKHIDHQVED